MADTTQLDYDQMQNIIKMFRSEQQEIMNLLKQTDSKVEGLHGSEWIGKGADQFFNEMKTDVLPAVQRLSDALGAAGEAAQKIVEIFNSADEETKGYFNNIGA
jgi:WXG100 family type VII secretion target